MESGFYNKDNELIMNWQELREKGYIKQAENILFKVKKKLHSYNMIIDDSIMEIGCDAFNEVFLKKLYIHKNIIKIDPNAFDNANIEEIIVDNCNKHYSSEKGILYDKNKTKIIKCACSIENIKLDKNIDTIGDSAFYETNIKDIEITNNCVTIEEYAFANTKIKKIDLTNVIEIASDGFSYCEELQEIIFPPNLTEINPHVFYRCQKLEEINLPESLVKIGHAAFHTCNLKGTLRLPDNLVNIDSSSFQHNKISTLIIPKSVKTIGKYCFADCPELNKLIYKGTEAEFKEIEGWEHVFACNELKIENVIFHKTLDELIDEGKSLREANNILKEQKEQAI